MINAKENIVIWLLRESYKKIIFQIFSVPVFTLFERVVVAIILTRCRFFLEFFPSLFVFGSFPYFIPASLSERIYCALLLLFVFFYIISFRYCSCSFVVLAFSRWLLNCFHVNWIVSERATEISVDVCSRKKVKSCKNKKPALSGKNWDLIYVP